MKHCAEFIVFYNIYMQGLSRPAQLLMDKYNNLTNRPWLSRLSLLALMCLKHIIMMFKI